jgi:hypothetical protein
MRSGSIIRLYKSSSWNKEKVKGVKRVKVVQYLSAKTPLPCGAAVRNIIVTVVNRVKIVDGVKVQRILCENSPSLRRCGEKKVKVVNRVKVVSGSNHDIALYHKKQRNKPAIRF